MNMKTTNKRTRILPVVLLASLTTIICIGGVSLGGLPSAVLSIVWAATSSVVFRF